MKDFGLKTWAEHNVKRLIDFTVIGKAIPHIQRDLARKSLGEQSGSLFTQMIADALPPKRIYTLKFNIYNDRSDLIDHVRYYQ